MTVSLITSLIEGSETDEGTKCVEWGADTEMLSTKPIPDLLEEDFWTPSSWSSLELADLATDKSSSLFYLLVFFPHMRLCILFKCFKKYTGWFN